jgi:hypothetical protein
MDVVLLCSKKIWYYYTPLPGGGGGYTVLPLSVQDIFRRIFLRNYWWHKFDIWSQASYRYPISWEAFFGPIRFLLPVCRLCWFLYTFNIHLNMHIFRRIFLSNYWWQESDILSQASYRYAILWEAFLNPSDSYFLFADLVDFYTHWTYMYMHIFPLPEGGGGYTVLPLSVRPRYFSSHFSQ